MACFYLGFNIGQQDINDATGNTNNTLNHKLYGVYANCSGEEITVEFESGGFYPREYCCNGDNGIIKVIYYRNNDETFATYSSYDLTNIVCFATPTPTPTPTITPTRTQTPSPTQIICGYGLTSDEYYYTDCCGNYIQGRGEGITVIFNYLKSSNGVTKLNSPATTTCVTPTPTKTPTPTPTITQTQTQTPTQTKTPTTTPSSTSKPIPPPVYRPKNECDVFTLFDMGLRCNVISIPSSSLSNDGVLTLDVTGGTSPYSFYWVNGQRSQTLNNIGPGSYECNVVDYYGDYSSTIVCDVFGPTPTPTPTVTITPTVTTSGVCPKLCFIATSLNLAYGPWQFICNGMYNGKTTWSNGTYNIIWNNDNTRWEIVSSDMTPFIADNGGIFVNTSNSSIPLSSWNSIGGKYVYDNITMTNGNCPDNIPLSVNITQNNSTCDGITNCDGSITIGAQYGQPPYLYSIDGLNYKSIGFFNNLCPGQYTVITKDSGNSVVTNTVNLGYKQTPITYQLSINLLSDKNIIYKGSGFFIKTTYLEVTTIPKLESGLEISFNIDFSSIKTIKGPGEGIITNNIVVYQNDVPNFPISNQTSTKYDIPRSDCSPETQTEISESSSYHVTLNSNTTVTIDILSQLQITLGEIADNGCVTELKDIVYVKATSENINGCSCCSVTTDKNDTLAVSETIAYDGKSVPRFYTINLGYSSDVCYVACDNYYTQQTPYYSLTNTFVKDTYLYQDVSCTLPVFGGYYSDGASCFSVDYGGKITNVGVCPKYYYYNMLPCQGIGPKIGRSTYDLSSSSNTTVVVSPNICYLVKVDDLIKYGYNNPYDYDLDKKDFVENCNDDKCKKPVDYTTWQLTYNNGDFSNNACPNNRGNQGPNSYYTKLEGLTNGVVLYIDNGLTNVAANGYYSNGEYSWTISEGDGKINGNPDNCN